MKYLHLVQAFIVVLLLCSYRIAEKKNKTALEDPIKPYIQNPKYWQYKGKPVLLLGASNNDNLFQSENLEAQLDELASVGGNYIRNTMSCRDSGDVFPYTLNHNGLYDLDEWGEAYWSKFAKLLKLTKERDIIVQIEIWDRFDYSQKFWEKHPFNPLNNINYSAEDSILNTDYPEHPSTDIQPFFHSIRGMKRYTPKLDVIREYQEKYIDKLLSYTFNYGNVLYCMNNETSTPVEWGNYWIDYIRAKAKENGAEIYLTDMYDYFFKISTCKECQELIARPDYYTFMDISQINSRNFGQAHWDTLQTILAMRDKYALRPANNTKIYGGGNFGFGTGTEDDGIERFCRNIIGGCASARHHRPPAGNGLNRKAKASIKAVRSVEKYILFWDGTPQMNLLTNREPNEAYILGRPGEHYVIYFTQEGKVTLDLTANKSLFELKWISVKTGNEKEKTQTIKGGKQVEIVAPDNDGWFAVIEKKS
ncbi:hypothetical protein GM418_26975 [Maribellus comscasis]|uniref:Uncharacterized protein n=1 Tax=Maribellus comscasis TaxID=2681766 RepID=A0A6I6KAG9_9BACT|nr:hypothetical protein [Maribellus comscasis]QGY47174.1 hypothetical protein GM418_26975 [Maribellus comscasis]